MFCLFTFMLLFRRPLIGKLADRYGPRKLLAPATSLPMFLLVGIVYVLALDLGIGLGAVTLGFLAQQMGYMYLPYFTKNCPIEQMWCPVMIGATFFLLLLDC